MPLVINVPRNTDRIQVESQQRLTLAFFGTPRFAVPSLRLLHEEGWPIGLVVTAPDKPVGRKAVMTASTVRTAAEELDLPVAMPATLKDEEFQHTFAQLRPDIAVVVAYGKLIPQAILDIPRLGFVNVHPSLLPAYRGPTPIRTAILDGCSSTGTSIMLLDAEMDHGPVLAQRAWSIPSGFDAPACESELASIGARLLADTLPGYADGTVPPKPQNHEAATSTKKFTRENGRLDWSQPVERINDRIRALGDDPGTWTTWRDTILNILQARPHPTPNVAKPGSVVVVDDSIGIACQDGVLMVERIQPEGGKTMDAAAFVNGRPEFIGSEVK
jgi:methionyl-tRNA formyltransferase